MTTNIKPDSPRESKSKGVPKELESLRNSVKLTYHEIQAIQEYVTTTIQASYTTANLTNIVSKVLYMLLTNPELDLEQAVTFTDEVVP